MEDFKTITDKNTSDLIHSSRDTIIKEFKQVQALNGLSGMMKLYSKISISKASGMLGVSNDEFVRLLQAFEKKESIELLNTPFE